MTACSLFEKIPLHSGSHTIDNVVHHSQPYKGQDLGVELVNEVVKVQPFLVPSARVCVCGLAHFSKSPLFTRGCSKTRLLSPVISHLFVQTRW